MYIPEVNLGKLIELRIKEVGMTKAEFGRRINTSRQNVNTLLRKKSWDTKLLIRCSQVLGQNFFKEFCPEEFVKSRLLEYDKVKVTGMALTIDLEKQEDIVAFLDWLAARKEIESREDSDKKKWWILKMA